MATFKTTIRKDRPRPDKSYAVYIRLTHNRATRYLNTGLSVTAKEVTASGKIKNQQVLDSCEDIIREYRTIVTSIGPAVTGLPIESLIDRLKKKVSDSASLSFTKYSEIWFANREKNSTYNRYLTAWRSFSAYMKRSDILFIDVTTKTMKSYEQSLSAHPSTMARYPGYIKKMFNDGRFYYNDEDNGILLIKHSLNRYTPPKEPTPEKRALSLAQLRQLLTMPYPTPKKNINRIPLTETALDVFRLSFCLLGTNTADLFNATDYKDGVFSYERQKTKTRRTDNAYIEIVVPDVVKPLFEKYHDNKRVFSFYKRYRDSQVFATNVALGMREIGRLVGIDGLTLYHARHTMATIAYNEVGIDKYTVNDMLNHTEPSMKITDVYITRSFKAVNEANAKLMTYVFGGTEKK